MSSLPKLFQWLLAVGSFLCIWLAVITETIRTDFTDANQQFILFLPLILIVAFGVYSVAVILYRVAIFNDCVEASLELKQQILDAREELSSKGLIFQNES